MRASGGSWPCEADTGKIALGEGRPHLAGDAGRAKAERVFYHDGEKIVCLSRGQRRAAVGVASRWRTSRSSRATSRRRWWPTRTWSCSPAASTRTISAAARRPIAALSAKDGKILWTAEQPPCGHHTPKDILVANGLVWYGEVAQATRLGRDDRPRSAAPARSSSSSCPIPTSPGSITAAIVRRRPTTTCCSRARGSSIIDTTTNHWTPNNWVRGGCLYGIMPCNGMMYVTPHPCACYKEAKLYGFTALAPAVEDAAAGRHAGRGPAGARAGLCVAF